MTRTARRILRILLLPLALTATPGTAAAQDRPNIVFLFSDDHAAHALSAYREHLRYGADLPPTPNLDRLAAEGMLFANSFVTNSICGPSRATVLTGQYGHLNGVMTNDGVLHPTHTTFPGLLRDAGYETVLFGKWHLKAEPSGFDHYEILAGQGPYYNPPLITGSDTTRHEGYTNDIITGRAMDWLRARDDRAGAGDGRADRPFLMMLHFNAPHRYWDPGPDQLAMFRDTLVPEPATFWDDGRGRVFPTRDIEMTIGMDLFERDLKLVAPDNLTPAQMTAWHAAYGPENEEYRELALTGDAATAWKYQRYVKDYMRAVLALDAAVGRVMDELDRSGLAGSTVLVYTSDQGFFLGDHGWFDKRWMYEESLRTPLLVRWPGVTPGGAVNTDMVMNLDLAQTFLEIGGAAAPREMQGRSMVPLLAGQTPTDWRNAIYYQYFAYPDWHMVHRQYGVRTHRYKLIHYYEVGEWELFDLARDPEEMRSVYGEPGYEAVTRELEERLWRLRSAYAVPVDDPVPHTPFVAPPELRRPESERPAPVGRGAADHRHPGG